jgi:superfamily II DNA/RNA helicase
MYSVGEIQGVVASKAFKADLTVVEESLRRYRLGEQAHLFIVAAVHRLREFVECVLSSAPDWEPQSRSSICQTAGEVAEALVLQNGQNDRMRLRSALLYELAGLPAISRSIAYSNNLPISIKPFLLRTERFSSLSESPTAEPSADTPEDLGHLKDFAIYSDTHFLANYLQGSMESFTANACGVLTELAKFLNVGSTASECKALAAVLQTRARAATRNFVGLELFAGLHRSAFPVELWPTQVAALESGMLDQNIESWGLAAPTGTGKTFLTQLLIVDTLRIHPDRKILYIAPSRALVHEVATDLGRVLQPFAYTVIAMTPQLVELDAGEGSAVEGASVIVLTPEKADMLLRLGLDIFKDLSLVIIDEAHHLESSTRGILLEMYLWRLRTLLEKNSRFVFLSAVAPNIGQITSWMRSRSQSVQVRQRPTRMRAGIYKIQTGAKNRIGVIEYTDGIHLPIVEVVEQGVRRQLVQLAGTVSKAGPVLIVAKGKGECETLAETALGWLKEEGRLAANENVETLERLDSRLEREMYPEVLLRALVANRIAYHHAGLPPRVRLALESAIKEHLVDYVFATTTLAEGVNFPFATVIVQSLAIREAPQLGRPAGYQPVTPRVFWNLAGRAGRPGYDREGQVLLFEPTIGLDKIVYALGDYFNSELTAVQPVRSALADSIQEIAKEVQQGGFSLGDLASPSLPEHVSRRVRGAVNLIRVSLLHARASKIVESYEEILDGTFANEMLDARSKSVARELFFSQDKLVEEFFRQPNTPSKEMAAELGLSIETLSALRDWVVGLESWQIRNFQKLLWGGYANLDQAKYVIGPVAKHMAELEGPKLGGFLSEVILLWLSGTPFTTLRSRLTGTLRSKTIEDLISLVYSRVQYLLPWGLYAADRLVEVEAARRKISYQNELRSLAYLADSGVSSFDAVRLVHAEFERTDAERIAAAYRRQGGLKLGMDIVQWLGTLKIENVYKIVRGADNRRIDYDLSSRLSALRPTNPPS